MELKNGIKILVGHVVKFIHGSYSKFSKELKNGNKI